MVKDYRFIPMFNVNFFLQILLFGCCCCSCGCCCWCCCCCGCCWFCPEPRKLDNCGNQQFRDFSHIICVNKRWQICLKLSHTLCSCVIWKRFALQLSIVWGNFCQRRGQLVALQLHNDALSTQQTQFFVSLGRVDLKVWLETD